MKTIISASLLIFMIACSGEDAKVFHPTLENLQAENIISAEEVKSKNNNSVYTKFLSTIEGMQEISSIGKLYGANEEMFGFIEDIVIDSFNRVYLLDSDKQHIRVFSKDGAYITTLGREGQGPGEFEGARSITNYNDQWLLVGNGYRIEVYDIQQEEIEFLKTVQFERWTHSICMLGNKLFMHHTQLFDQAAKKIKEAKNFIKLIQAYSMPSFELLFSFGQSYKSTNPMVVDRMSAGSLSCNKSSSTVIFAFEKMPVLKGYSAKNGQLKWTSRIDGLHLADVIQTDKGGRTTLIYRVPESNMMDRIAPSVSYKDEYEILQVHRRITPEESYETEMKVLTFLLNSSNGKANLLSKKLPAVLNISNNLAATVSDNYMISRIYRLDE